MFRVPGFGHAVRMNRTSISGHAPRWSSTRRWLLRVALALLALYALYLAAANLWINTAWGERTLNRKPEKFQMHWAGGHSWWPGRVSLREVKLQGQVRRIAWQAQASAVQGEIALWPLLRRELHVPWVQADGVSGGVHRAERELPVPPPRDGGWVLRFDRITSDSLTRGEFDGLRLDGEGSAQVGFVKQLRGGPMELLPSRAAFRKARLARDGEEVLREAELDATFAIARHRREEAPGLRKLLKTDARLKLRGITSAIDVTPVPGGVTLALVPGRGQANIDLGFSGGALTPGSRLQWSMPIGGSDASGVSRTDALGIALAVDRQDIALKVKAPPLAQGRMSVDADLRLRGRELPLGDFPSLLPRASGHVVGRWRFSSLHWITSLFPRMPWLQLEGAGDVDADVQVVNGQLAAGSRIGVPEVDAVADVMGNRIRGRAHADIRLDAGPKGELVPRLQAVMEQFHVASVRAPQRPYVQGRNLRLFLNADGPLQDLRNAMRGRVVFDNANVPDLRVYNPYLPRRHMRFDGGAGFLSGDLSLDTAGDVGHGRLRITGRGARMHLAGIDLRGDVDIGLALRRADLRRRAFVADGSTVQFRNLGFREPGGDARSGWWAKLRLDRARLDVDRPLSAGGSAAVQMKDVGFLLALFSRKKDYPKWVYRLVDAGQAQADGRVQWRDDVLVLDRVKANNDRFDLQARLRLQGPRRSGQLYARWGVLSAGLELQDNARRWHLVKAREWYQGQPDLLR